MIGVSEGLSSLSVDGSGTDVKADGCSEDSGCVLGSTNVGRLDSIGTLVDISDEDIPGTTVLVMSVSDGVSEGMSPLTEEPLISTLVVAIFVRRGVSDVVTEPSLTTFVGNSTNKVDELEESEMAVPVDTASVKAPLLDETTTAEELIPGSVVMAEGGAGSAEPTDELVIMEMLSRLVADSKGRLVGSCSLVGEISVCDKELAGSTGELIIELLLGIGSARLLLTRLLLTKNSLLEDSGDSMDEPEDMAMVTEVIDGLEASLMLDVLSCVGIGSTSTVDAADDDADSAAVTKD